MDLTAQGPTVCGGWTGGKFDHYSNEPFPFKQKVFIQSSMDADKSPEIDGSMH